MKANDHLMNATRYLVVSGLDHLRVEPVKTAAWRNIGVRGWAG